MGALERVWRRHCETVGTAVAMKTIGGLKLVLTVDACAREWAAAGQAWCRGGHAPAADRGAGQRRLASSRCFSRSTQSPGGLPLSSAQEIALTPIPLSCNLSSPLSHGRGTPATSPFTPSASKQPPANLRIPASITPWLSAPPGEHVSTANTVTTSPDPRICAFRSPGSRSLPVTLPLLCTAAVPYIARTLRVGASHFRLFRGPSAPTQQHGRYAGLQHFAHDA